MADRRATNKYYPPDYDPSQGSLNKYRGQHPLRERARKLDQGILIVRFEMPFHTWCLHCDKHIATGVRFNAEKKQHGSYHSTKIWQFSMPCPRCSGELVVRTDPSTADFVCVSGVRKQVVRAADPKSYGAVEFMDREERERVRKHPMSRLEHGVEDQRAAIKAKPRIDAITRGQERMREDYALSKLVRARFRGEEKRLREGAEEAKARGLVGRLLEASEEDRALARTTQFSRRRRPEAVIERHSARQANVFQNESKAGRALVEMLAAGVDKAVVQGVVRRAAQRRRRAAPGATVKRKRQEVEDTPSPGKRQRAERGDGDVGEQDVGDEEARQQPPGLALLGAYGSDSDSSDGDEDDEDGD